MRKLSIILFLVISFSTFAKGYNLKEISNVLKHVETNYNPKAIGDNGLAFGILQIHKGAVLDVNRYYGTNYKHYHAMEPNCAEEIFILYISLGIKLYYKKHNRMPSEKRVVQFWNFGIYQEPYDNGYYKKYLYYKERI